MTLCKQIIKLSKHSVSKGRLEAWFCVVFV